MDHESFIDKIGPTCEHCKGRHDTSNHEESKKDHMTVICDICTGQHQASEHDALKGLKRIKK